MPCVSTLKVLSSMEDGNPAFFRAAAISDPKPPSAPYLGRMDLPYWAINALCSSRTFAPLLPFLSGKSVSSEGAREEPAVAACLCFKGPEDGREESGIDGRGSAETTGAVFRKLSR